MDNLSTREACTDDLEDIMRIEEELSLIHI